VLEVILKAVDYLSRIFVFKKKEKGLGKEKKALWVFTLFSLAKRAPVDEAEVRHLQPNSELGYKD
jgi:hypothetical protein